MICGCSCSDGSVGLISGESAEVSEEDVGRFGGMLKKAERLL